MKTIDIFCASQASTAISMSMDQPSSSTAAAVGGRAIDRHNPIIRDQKRAPRGLPLAPCTSQSPPINPQPYHLLHKSTKKDAAAKGKTTNTDLSKKSVSHRKTSQKKDKNVTKLAVGDDGNSNSNGGKDKEVVAVTKSWVNRSDFITPPTSSRYLLSDKELFDGLSDYDPVLASSVHQQESNSSKSVSTSNNINDSTEKEKPSSNQVVVLRVSLHCRGCEGKVRKHLSRMEGVRSYSIDFAAKKVTIVGDVTPLSVLASVSKVKNAQFWTGAAPLK
ncbi:hypothetical protein JCGZ_09013 [Jatropha curcas]|uniref:HMA domain-containing protein n=1 Tax=Jatropha curcas TaxID=180498 RepID=A0A067KTH0_JATCU|nr:protein SODIUM POTASSIUM ROOT DEFECTIVE 3 [Jatropha curcas]KDP35575.1 hypothetical protein JCGZ_09013 [Jatropha curcas]